MYLIGHRVKMSAVAKHSMEAGAEPFDDKRPDQEELERNLLI